MRLGAHSYQDCYERLSSSARLQYVQTRKGKGVRRMTYSLPSIQYKICKLC